MKNMKMKKAKLFNRMDHKLFDIYVADTDADDGEHFDPNEEYYLLNDRESDFDCGPYSADEVDEKLTAGWRDRISR